MSNSKPIRALIFACAFATLFVGALATQTGLTFAGLINILDTSAAPSEQVGQKVLMGEKYEVFCRQEGCGDKAVVMRLGSEEDEGLKVTTLPDVTKLKDGDIFYYSPGATPGDPPIFHLVVEPPKPVDPTIRPVAPTSAPLPIERPPAGPTRWAVSFL